MKTKTYAFNESYGSFTENLTYGNLELNIKITHRKSVCVNLDNDPDLQIHIGCIVGKTPKTYYSGNRKYGKYIFIVPENVKVVKKYFGGNSNAEAWAKNTCLIKGSAYSGESFGFDFYKVITIGDDEVSMEVAERIIDLTLVGLGDLDINAFLANLMSDNIIEVIPDFKHQTSGWRYNEEKTYLYAITSIDGISCFVPFAANTSEIEEIPNVGVRYLKCIN